MDESACPRRLANFRPSGAPEVPSWLDEKILAMQVTLYEMIHDGVLAGVRGGEAPGDPEEYVRPGGDLPERVRAPAVADHRSEGQRTGWAKVNGEA